jgi:DNA gyrase subunit A
MDDNERIIGALSLDKRLEQPEKMLALSRQGYGLRFALAPHTELSTRAGRRFGRPAQKAGDELIAVVPVHDRDRVAVISEKSHLMVTKSSEVNELAGPGRGVTVIKLDKDDKVIAFLVTSSKNASVQLETAKGRKLTLEAFDGGTQTRGGKGHQLVKKDKVKPAATGPVVQTIPEEKK